MPKCDGLLENTAGVKKKNAEKLYSASSTLTALGMALKMSV